MRKPFALSQRRKRGPNESSATVDTDLLCSAVSAQGAERDEESVVCLFFSF